jgi:hypothetical protein
MYAELKLIVCEDCKQEKPTRFYKTAKKCQGCSKEAWKKAKAERRAAKRKADPESHSRLDFESDLMKNYGITAAQYDEMYEAQNGKCDCCKRPEAEFKRGLHVDHDHVTGQVRALLCTKCNPGLGYFDDDIEKLEMAIAYLKKFKK